MRIIKRLRLIKGVRFWQIMSDKVHYVNCCNLQLHFVTLLTISAHIVNTLTGGWVETPLNSNIKALSQGRRIFFKNGLLAPVKNPIRLHRMDVVALNG